MSSNQQIINQLVTIFEELEILDDSDLYEFKLLSVHDIADFLQYSIDRSSVNEVLKELIFSYGSNFIEYLYDEFVKQLQSLELPLKNVYGQCSAWCNFKELLGSATIVNGSLKVNYEDGEVNISICNSSLRYTFDSLDSFLKTFMVTS